MDGRMKTQGATRRTGAQTGERVCTWACAAVVLLCTIGPASRARAAAHDEEVDYAKFIEKHSPALVTVKFLLKLKMGSYGEQESESELTGVMIDPRGLVLCSLTEMTGSSFMRRMMGGEFSAVPSDIKVLVGDDTEGVEAELLARDSELDLAWVRIKQPADKPYACVDLSKSSKPKLGQRVLALRRMGKYFDRSIVLCEGRIGGMTRKPRELYVPDDQFISGYGLPVFSVSGELIGLMVLQASDEGEGGSSRRFGVGSGDSMATLILPAANVLKATQQARESISRDAAEKDTPKGGGKDAEKDKGAEKGPEKNAGDGGP